MWHGWNVVVVVEYTVSFGQSRVDIHNPWNHLVVNAFDVDRVTLVVLPVLLERLLATIAVRLKY